MVVENHGFRILEHFLGPLYYACTQTAYKCYSFFQRSPKLVNKPQFSIYSHLDTGFRFKNLKLV
jgi:hypothetical protein